LDSGAHDDQDMKPPPDRNVASWVDVVVMDELL